MAITQWFKCATLTFCAALTINSWAQEAQTEIKYYDNDDVTNRIPVFDNRFRLDAQLEEITLLFYRKNGSPPVILVRPDGSKLKVSSFPKDKVQWFDDATFDMIRIVKPMPGPWQAIGDIMPESKIMVVSEVNLEVEPLPEILLSGETIKVTAKVYNREKVIDDPLFNAVINLDIDFYSTNNTAYDNFGAENVEIGSFRDDGYDLDEFAKDGLFTGEFVLNFSAGEWIPVYYIKMPMAERELRQQPIIIQKNPVSLSVETTKDPLSSHKLTININDEYVDPDSLLFQGKITYPDRQTEPFAIMEGKGISRIKEIGYTEPGVHRVTLNVFGHTKDNREFRLVVPDFTFNVDRDDNPLIPNLNDQDEGEESAEDIAAQIAEQLAQEKAARAKALEEEMEAKRLAAEEQAMTNLIIVISANVVIIGAAIIGFVLIRRKKR